MKKILFIEILFIEKNKISTSTKDKAWQLDFFNMYTDHAHRALHLCCNQVCSTPERVHKCAFNRPVCHPSWLTLKRSSLKKLRLQQFDWAQQGHSGSKMLTERIADLHIWCAMSWISLKNVTYNLHWKIKVNNKDERNICWSFTDFLFIFLCIYSAREWNRKTCTLLLKTA